MRVEQAREHVSRLLREAQRGLSGCDREKFLTVTETLIYKVSSVVRGLDDVPPPGGNEGGPNAAA